VGGAINPDCNGEIAAYHRGIKLTIRQAVLADADILVRFNIELARESENLALEPARVKAGVEALLRDPAKGTYFVADAGGEVVGQLLITHEWSDWRNGDFWWLQSVFVRSDFRKRGVFKTLFDSVLKSAKEKGDVAGVRLYVEQHNDPAHKAYARLGFKETHYRVLERLVP
jgi:GNAT superfamily N-acetyltransferase